MRIAKVNTPGIPKRAEMTIVTIFIGMGFDENIVTFKIYNSNNPRIVFITSFFINFSIKKITTIIAIA